MSDANEHTDTPRTEGAKARFVMKRPVFIAAFVSLSAAMIGLDQWTKVLAERFLAGRGAIRVLGDFVVLVFAQNTGAFLAMGSGLSEPLRIAGLIVVPSVILAAAIVFFCAKQEPTVRSLAILCLLSGGGFGNIIDRIFKGKVTDFLNFGIGKLRTGVMNVADLYILALVIILVLGILLEKRKAASGGSGAGA